MSGHGEAVDPRKALKSLAAVLIVLAGFWIVGHYLGHDISDNSLFGLGFLILAGIAAGQLCGLVGLPSLTGYLIAGFLSGPSLMNIVSDEQVTELRLVNGLALALIALHAGSEFTKEMLQKNFKSLFHSTWCNIVIIALGTIALMMVAQPYVDFLKDLDRMSMVSIAAVFSVFAISKSPAAVVAILGETKIKNKLSDHAIGIVVILDVVVLVLFALVLAVARTNLEAGASFSLSELGDLLGEIWASIAAGTFFGLLIIFYLWLIDKERLLFVVAISYGVTALCSYLHYDTLLVFVVAGFMVTNFSKQSKKLISTIESLSSVVMIAFFATTGASLHLDDLLKLWPIALAVFSLRFALTWAAEGTAHKLAKSDLELKKYGFTPFISQAGLAIGIAMIIYEKVPGVGPQLATLAISVVTLNEIVGPIFFKWGLNQVEKMKSPADTTN